MGPNGKKNLRKRFAADTKIVRKLVHGTLAGRGSQRKKDEGACIMPVEGDVVAIHVGSGVGSLLGGNKQVTFLGKGFL